MEKIKTQEVYVPVVISPDERPDLVYYDIWRIFNGENQGLTTKAKRHTDKYLLSKEDIIKIVGDAFYAGESHEFVANSKGEGNEPDKENYIDNLFK